MITGFDGTFNSWLAMMRRCYLTADSGYRNYGGRGIDVCERWFDWRNFLNDMGPRPDGTSLDRKDYNGPYSPENCRWADQVTQAGNTRRNVFVDVDGVQMLSAEAARKLGVSPATISRRRKKQSNVAFRRPLKLTEAQVAEIKAKLRMGIPRPEIAKEFGVTRQHIYGIATGKTWSAVT